MLHINLDVRSPIVMPRLKGVLVADYLTFEVCCECWVSGSQSLEGVSAKNHWLRLLTMYLRCEDSHTERIRAYPRILIPQTRCTPDDHCVACQRIYFHVLKTTRCVVISTGRVNRG